MKILITKNVFTLLYNFCIAVIANYHKFGGLKKNPNLLSYHCGRQKSKSIIRDIVLLEALGECIILFLVLFILLLEATDIPWFLVLPSV